MQIGTRPARWICPTARWCMCLRGCRWPMAMFRSVFPAARLPALREALASTGSVTAALRAAGVADYTRASTRLTAKPASATMALHLRVAEQSPLLRSVAINVDPKGTPVEYGKTWFAGDRVTLTLAPES